MEEKERYEIHIYDDVCVDLLNDGVLDKSINNTYKLEDLLNQQDKRIKELEEENLSLQEQSIRDNQNWIEETTKLKQQLYDLSKKIVSEIKDCLLDFSNGWWRYFVTDGCEYMLSSDLQGCLDETIDTVLKKYGGEDEQNIRKS